MTILSADQIRFYRTNGFLLADGGIKGGILRSLRDEVARLYSLDHPGRTFEADGVTVRGIHGCHQQSDFFAELVRVPQLLSAAGQIVGDDLYVHQLKVNAKRALAGDVWPWHQDYIFWEQRDGMRKPQVVNVALFLDDVTDHSGPLLMIPGSHRAGVISALPAGSNRGPEKSVPDRNDWASQVSADLDFSLSVEQIAPLVAQGGIQQATGPAGTLLFFDSLIVHGSGTNMSPFDRSIALITYNSTRNRLAEVPSPRPAWLASRDYRALTPLPADHW